MRLHNRTQTELVIKTFVRRGQSSVATTATYRLPSLVQSGPFEESPDLEVPLFAQVPLDPDLIGAYSLEVLTDKFESRLAVIDISRQEMEDAKASTRFIVVFRPSEITVMVGKKKWVQPWMRELPKPVSTDRSFAPKRLQDESEDREKSNADSE